ncbi:MAG: GNAT family N-acetyltransferase [bacterium]|nr:GNAT family N-acetyltransferase [bacterium]
MIKIVEVKSDEIKELAELASEIWHEYWTDLLSDGQIDYMLDKFQSEKAMKNQLNNENYTYFYLISDNQKAGYLALAKRKDYLFLSKMYIKGEHRHKGIGTKAFDFAKKYAADNGYSKIRLTVKKDNQNSINAYLKWGFKTVDSIVTDIGGGFVMDDYVMDYEIKGQTL